MRKKTQAINITNWYAIDSILFENRPLNDVLTEEEHKNYLVAKGAALSNLFEIYVKLDYVPSYKFSNLKEMEEFGRKRGKLAKERAAELLTTDGISEEVREEIEKTELSEGVSKEDYARYLVSKKLKSTALDIVMIESALATSKNKTKLTDYKGQILTDAYKVFRDALLKYSE